MRVNPAGLLAFLICALAAPRLAFGQITTTLQPDAAAAFDQYARHVEDELELRWTGKKPFLSIDEDLDQKRRVLAGAVLVWSAAPNNPIPAANALIHDWTGAVFMPGASMQKVLSILQNFNEHSHIYPEIVKSHLIRHDGNDITGFWRIERKQGLITVDLDVIDEAHYRQISPDKWVCRAYAKDIREVDNAGTGREYEYPAGEGTGFLWRLYAFWSLEATDHGVLAECRTLSLSRSLPAGVAWMIKPLLQKLPREPLTSTLENTRSAAAKH